jgi:hypothetical protein
MEFTLEGLNRITDWLARTERFFSVVLATVIWGVNAYLGVFRDAWAMIQSKIGEADPSAIGTANFSILEGVGYVNAVFPLDEVIGLYSIYFTAWLCLITIRWVKSFIPTVAN